MKAQTSLISTALRSRWTCVACRQRQQQLVQSRKLSTSIFQRDPLPQDSRDKRLRESVVGSIRPLHTSRPLGHEADEQRQAVPLGDFYTDLLANPTPASNKSQGEKETSLPTFVQSGDKTKEERAKMLFGSIEGSGYERHTYDKPDNTWRTINGVPVPPRPAEPDNCCMSGCVHCVWDDYRDDIESWASRVAEAQAKSPKKRSHPSAPKIEMSRPEVDHASGSMDDDGGGSEALWTTPSSSADEDDVLFQGIPVGIRHFMATEKRIRERRRAKREKGASADDYE